LFRGAFSDVNDVNNVLQVSYAVRTGDEVNCLIAKLQPLKAKAEEIPLDIEYEDEHLLVVNKPPHMVRIILC